MKFLIAFILSCSLCFGVTDNEKVAAVIIGEAGGEGEIGMQAVANVIANRKGTPFEVISKRYQFCAARSVIVDKTETWQQLVDRRKRHPRWGLALEMVEKIYELPDVTNGATHFHTPAVNPKWAKVLAFKKRIGNHLFYREGA